ncbi:unnamed protein product [Acanthoscelides obtectus]|uniref:Uncharacterized protein n=1 Tax=Acanthoscelides obtectus TaxID=200917 RepID=A0A9P0PRD7_ACAOB|nr:unnamed protein product [Acanthoscelides obtectus]CAK1631682.1 hypothetical protein AOBTE_LOCUS7093 [Acanthoscelides obtectus]
MVLQELSKKDDDKKTNERLMKIIEAQQRAITDLTVKLDLLLETEVCQQQCRLTLIMTRQ